MDAHGVADTLDHSLTEIFEIEVAGDQRRCRIGDVGRPRFGELLHPLREPNGEPDRGEVHGEVCAHRPDDHLAGVQADPDRELQSLRLNVLGVVR